MVSAVVVSDVVVLGVRAWSTAVLVVSVDPSAQPAPRTETVCPSLPTETVTTSPVWKLLCLPACVTVTVNDCGAATVPTTIALEHF